MCCPRCHAATRVQTVAQGASVQPGAVWDLWKILLSRPYLALDGIKTGKFLQMVSLKRWGFHFDFKTYLLYGYLILVV